ncbi:MAG: anthranilate synthase component I family protein [Owenweeksia sp.]
MKLHLDPARYPSLKEKLINSSHHEKYFMVLDSNKFKDPYGKYDWIIATGARNVFIPEGDKFTALKNYHQQHNCWLFGHLNYNVKNELEALHTSANDDFQFPLMLFFEPEIVIYSKDGDLLVESELENENSFARWLEQKNPRIPLTSSPVKLSGNTSRDEYISNIGKLKDHLQYGNIYELNYCIEFNGYANLQPEDLYCKLTGSSPAPFASFYKCNDQYLICSSPERYLCKKGSQLISQPIKGTAARSADPDTDQKLRTQLVNSEKERSENVMIVDLVRNDLSRTAAPGSVKVEELFGIYSFPAVHQMVSTISSRLSDDFHFSDAIRYSFPMGSMTGAPKIRAMKIIDEHETFSRSIYSGSVGYISPDGDFDFNVVIRSIMYNAPTRLISARVGSAITIHCDAAKEYEECLLKAEKLFMALQ